MGHTVRFLILTNKSFQLRCSTWRCSAKQIFLPKETKAWNIQWLRYWNYKDSMVSFFSQKWLNNQVWMERQWDYVLRVFLYTGNKTYGCIRRGNTILFKNNLFSIFFSRFSNFSLGNDFWSTNTIWIPASISRIGKSFILITRMLLRIISKDNLISDTFRYTWLDLNFEILTISFSNKFFQF